MREIYLPTATTTKFYFTPELKWKKNLPMIFESKHDGEGGGGGVLATGNNLIAEGC